MMEERSARKSSRIETKKGSKQIEQVNVASDVVTGNSSSVFDDFSHLCHIDCPRKQSGKTKRSQKKDCQFKTLQLLKDCRKDWIERLLIQKIRFCSTVLNHSIGCTRSSEIKLATLNELIDYFRDDKDIPANVIGEIINMFGANVFRTLPPAPSCQPYELEPDDEEFSDILSNPAWPCLEAVYHLFLSFLESPKFQPSTCKNLLRHKFILSLLPLFESPDQRERDLLKLVLYRIYQVDLSLRPFIRKQIVNIFQTFIYETGRHPGVGELLEILSSIIDGFVLPLKEEHKRFLLKTLLPLHTPSSYSAYNNQIAYCVRQYLVKDPTLTVPVFKALLRFWPKCNSSKETMFLLEVEEILLCDDRVLDECKKIKLPLLKQLLTCATCPHIQAMLMGMVVGCEGQYPLYGNAVSGYSAPQLQSGAAYYGGQLYHRPTGYNQGYGYGGYPTGMRSASTPALSANSEEALDYAEKTAMEPLNSVMSSLPSTVEYAGNGWQNLFPAAAPSLPNSRQSGSTSNDGCAGKNCSEPGEGRSAGTSVVQAESSATPNSDGRGLPTQSSCCCQSCSNVYSGWIYAGYPYYDQTRRPSSYLKSNAQSRWDYPSYRSPYQTVRQGYPQGTGKTYWLPWWRPAQPTYQNPAGSYQINPYSNRMYYSGRY